jgi:hypothetical protein
MIRYCTPSGRRLYDLLARSFSSRTFIAGLPMKTRTERFARLA